MSKNMRGETKMKIILASASPRRKELLGLIVQNFDICVSNVDEKMEECLCLEEKVTKLANVKAKSVFDKTGGDRIVIGADTIVTKDGKIYGKPKDRDDAKNMLKELISGDGTHRVLTGLSVIVEKAGEMFEYNTYDETKIFLKKMTDEEIDRWIDSGKAMDKAGAYGIQNEFCVYVDRIEGNYTTVVGLPTAKLYEIMKEYILMNN